MYTILLLIASNVFMTFAWYGHLKVMQEIITMVVFAFFAYFYMNKPLSLNFLYAGLCMVGAAYFMFKS